MMSAKKSKAAKRPPGEIVSNEGPLSELAAGLALAVPAESPPPEVKQRLLERVRNSRTMPPPGWRFESAGAPEGWRATVFPGLRFKTLSVDEARDAATVLIEMAPGARFPDHLHDEGGDEGILLSGDVITGGRLMRPGDYYFAAEGTMHSDTVSPNGCTALVNLTARAWKKWRAMSPA